MSYLITVLSLTQKIRTNEHNTLTSNFKISPTTNANDAMKSSDQHLFCLGKFFINIFSLNDFLNSISCLKEIY